MSGVHKHPTISFRVSDREREMIEARILASGMQKKCFCVTFDESNKARARKPRSMPISGANMTDKRKGKIAYGENDKCNDRKRFCEP